MNKEFLIRTQMILGDEVLKLQDKSVLVLGVGGVGSFAAEAIARSGVGNIILCDHDDIAMSNINRQLIALNSTVGKNKAEVMAERILDINPNCNVSVMPVFYSKDNSDIFFEKKIDYIIDAIDVVTSKIHLIKTAKEKNVNIISALGTGNKLDPSKFQIKDISKTSVCPLARVVRRELKNIGIKNHTVLFSTEEPIQPKELEEPVASRRSVPGSNAWTPSCAGLMIAGYVIQKLIENEGE